MIENTISRILEICKEKDIPISRLEKDLGFGNGSLNPEKATDIKSLRLFKILNYLGVSFEEFYGVPVAPIKEEIPDTVRDEDDEITDYMINLIKKLPIEYKIQVAHDVQSLLSDQQDQDAPKESV